MTPINVHRLAQALALSAVVAALASPALALGSNPGKVAPDWIERYAAAHPYGVGVIGTTQAPDWIERYAAAHPYGVGVIGTTQAPTVLIDGRSPDTRDAADAARLQLADGRSPDTLDAAVGSKPTVTVQPGGFHWGDAGLGSIVTAMLLGFAAASLLLLTRFRRHHRVHTT